MISCKINILTKFTAIYSKNLVYFYYIGCLSAYNLLLISIDWHLYLILVTSCRFPLSEILLNVFLWFLFGYCKNRVMCIQDNAADPDSQFTYLGNMDPDLAIPS